MQQTVIVCDSCGKHILSRPAVAARIEARPDVLDSASFEACSTSCAAKLLYDWYDQLADRPENAFGAEVGGDFADA